MTDSNWRKHAYLNRMIMFCKAVYGLDEQFVKMCVSDGLDLYSAIAREKNLTRDKVKNDLFIAAYGDKGRGRHV